MKNIPRLTVYHLRCIGMVLMIFRILCNNVSNFQDRAYNIENIGRIIKANHCLDCSKLRFDQIIIIIVVAVVDSKKSNFTFNIYITYL